MLGDPPLPSSTSISSAAVERFDLMSEAEGSTRSVRGFGALFAIAGGVLVGLGLYTWWFQAAAFSGRPGAVAVIAGPLVVFGIALILMGLIARIRPTRAVRAVVVDDQGVQLEMTRPPHWTLRWDQPGSYLNLSRGFRVGAPDEADPKGWVVDSRRLSTTVNGKVGKAIIDAARARGYRVVVETMAGTRGQRVFEIVTVDHPSNPERLRRPIFRNPARPFT